MLHKRRLHLAVLVVAVFAALLVTMSPAHAEDAITESGTFTVDSGTGAKWNLTSSGTLSVYGGGTFTLEDFRALNQGKQPSRIVFQDQVALAGDSASEMFAYDMYVYDDSGNQVDVQNNLKLLSVDVSGFDTSNIKDMSKMFYNTAAIKELDLSSFDTSNVTTMAMMFGHVQTGEYYGTQWWDGSSELACYSLESLDVSSFDTARVKNMTGMFAGCVSLKSLDVSSFNTARVTSMEAMFKACRSLTSLDVSNFNTSKVTSMGGYVEGAYGMFAYCTSLTSLNLSSFDTSNVEEMTYLFVGCTSLKSLNLSSFDTSKVKRIEESGENWSSVTSQGMMGIFGNCTALEAVKFGPLWVWDLESYNYLGTSGRWGHLGFVNNAYTTWTSEDAQDKGPYTADVLVNKWNGTTMAGTWKREGSTVEVDPDITVAPPADANPAEGVVPAASYTTHVQNKGWIPAVGSGASSGSTGEGLRLEGIKLSLPSSYYTGDITYRVHAENYGWMSWEKNGAFAGTEGEGLRLEALQIKLTGDLAEHYDVYYRVHAENYGWLAWTKNGLPAGTAGHGLRLESVQIMLVDKYGSAPSFAPYSTSVRAFIGGVQAQSHVENIGWQTWATSPDATGTSGLGLRLEAMRVQLTGLPFEGSIKYRTHIENYGWSQGFVADGALAGTEGKGLRLEAIQIELEGEVAQYYDVYYRVHAENFGWLGWAKNGEQSGTAGYGYRLESLEVVLVEKGATFLGATTNSFYQKAA